MAENEAYSSSSEPYATDWLEEDRLMLLACWSRDGFTYNDIAKKIGIAPRTLRNWRDKHPEIAEALRGGREIIDYKVENALLKSALGYKTKEVKITTIIRGGQVVETQKETVTKEQAPNVSACQCWLYNRLPKKWKNMNSRANILDNIADDEDASVQITITRAAKNNDSDSKQDWDDVNQEIEVRKSTPEEKAEKEKAKAQQKKSNEEDLHTKVVVEPDDDLDYWPDDWEDEESDEWED